MNSMDDILDYVQEIDPLWSVVLVAIALAVLLAARLSRASFLGIVAVVIALAVVGALAAGGYYSYLQYEETRRLDERRALDERVEALFSKTIEPDSVFACIDGSPAPAMLEACERSLFAEPARVAAAVAIVTQRIAFLDDAIAFAEQRDPDYAKRIESMRNSIEADPYGFVAFVLSVEHRCTPDSCARFALLRDAERVKENMRVRRLEAYLAKHSTTWRGSSELPADTVPTVGGPRDVAFCDDQRRTEVAPAISESDASPREELPVGVAPVIIPREMVIAPMITPPSAATAAAEPPAAASAPVVAPAAEAGFAEPPTPAEPAAPVAARPAPAKGAEPAAKNTTRPAGQAKAKARPVDPAARRSNEPVAGLPRVVPSEYIREQEEKEEASAQSSTPAPGAPVPISPPQQNFIGR
jgi:hypothetical protein